MMRYIEDKKIKVFASEQGTDHSEKVKNKIKEVVVVELCHINFVDNRDEVFL